MPPEADIPLTPKKALPDRMTLLIWVGLVVALMLLWWQPWDRGYRLPVLGEQTRYLIDVMPVLVALVGLIAAIWFGRSRLALALTIMAGLQILCTTIFSHGPRAVMSEEIIYGGTAILVPLGLGLLACLNDAPISSKKVLLQAAILILSAGVLAILAFPNGVFLPPMQGEWLQDRASQTIYADPLGLSLGLMTPLPPLGYIASFLSIGILFFLTARDTGATSLGFLVACISAGLALHGTGHGYLPSLIMLAGTFALVMALLQDAYRLAYVDELTSLPGRRALDQALKHSPDTFVVAMLDIDHFKKFNDTHGHDVGDQVLRKVAARLKAVTGGGRPFRYGGEEFSILFPGKGLDEAAHNLESVRRAIAQEPFAIRDESRPKATKAGQGHRGKKAHPADDTAVIVTISIGYAAREDDPKESPQSVIKRADEALYRAKESGRNRVSR